jgi:RNA 2',3'-cyclic 3'-phosphodiesterase
MSFSKNRIARCFIGAEIHAPWLDTPLDGRIIAPIHRHLTLLFLGNISLDELFMHMDSFPKPSFVLAPSGILDRLLFLPKEDNCRVVAANVQGMNREIETFQEACALWFQSWHPNFSPHDFLPHVTLARSPFDPKEWENSFSPLPFFIPAIHIYESIGNLTYHTLRSFPLIAPFEEFQHTADMAFYIRGRGVDEIFFHAQLALSFYVPNLLSFIDSRPSVQSLDEVIIALNDWLARADEEEGIPFKAVSFHGKMEKIYYDNQNKHQLFQWEMIVDV